MLLLCSVHLTAMADTFKLPENKPVVSFILPDSWNPTETATGFEAASVDGEIYLALEFYDSDSVKDVIESNMTYLVQQGVTMDDKATSQGDFTVNDMSIKRMSYQGKDKDGPCEVTILIDQITPEKGLMITYWGSTEAGDKHKESLDKILNSITKI
jgi:hypothetical protein